MEADVKEDSMCAVCYMDYSKEEMVNKDGLCKCPECSNVFHVGCMRIWMKESEYKNCVYCRSEVWRIF